MLEDLSRFVDARFIKGAGRSPQYIAPPQIQRRSARGCRRAPRVAQRLSPVRLGGAPSAASVPLPAGPDSWKNIANRQCLATFGLTLATESFVNLGQRPFMESPDPDNAEAARVRASSG